jgi:hypothetical protein
MDDEGHWMGTGKGFGQSVGVLVECHAAEAEGVSPVLTRRLQNLIEALSLFKLKTGEPN